MSKTICWTALLAVGLLASGREARAQSSEYGEYALYYLNQGENLALNAYESNQPIYQGQSSNPYYYYAYVCAYYAQYYAQQASYSDSADDWYAAYYWALYAYYYEPSTSYYAKSSLYDGCIYAYYAYYYASQDD